MLCYVQSLSSSPVVGPQLQLLLCRPVFMCSVHSGFSTQQFLSEQSVLNA